jgi:hypothetical protein
MEGGAEEGVREGGRVDLKMEDGAEGGGRA